MFVFGHIAGAVLASRPWAFDSRIAIAATLFPDVIDKSAKHILGLVPFGRIPAHTLLVLGLTTLIVLLIDRRAKQGGRWVGAWLAGFGTHLLLDFADLVPLLWPFRDYEWPLRTFGQGMAPSPVTIASFVLEMLLIAAVLVVEIRRRRRARLAISSQY